MRGALLHGTGSRAILPMQKLDAMVKMATLSDLPALGAAILRGEVQGRIVVDVNA